MKNHSTAFILTLIVTAVIIAGVAAFFSIYGLAHIYSAAFMSVVIMASALEVGKLVTVSFLYRYWETITWWMKTYLFVAVVGLMVITSAGIFGYLSNAYQQDSIKMRDVEQQIALLESEAVQLAERERQIDEDVGRVAANFITKRMELMDRYAPEKEFITERRRVIREDIFALSSKQLEVEAHTGPIIYIARAFGKDTDTAIMWMTLLIIFVFDPLAIALTIGYNIALMERRKFQLISSSQDDTPPPSSTIAVPIEPTREPTVSPESSFTAEEDAFEPLEGIYVYDEDHSTLYDLMPDDGDEPSAVSEKQHTATPTTAEPPSSQKPERSSLLETNMAPRRSLVLEEPIPTITTNEQLSSKLHSVKQDVIR